MKSTIQCFFVIVVLCLCNSEVIIAQWSTDPSVNNAICTEASDQLFPNIVSDESGGAIITWQDQRGADDDIYAQRISASGVVQWTTNGVPICTAITSQTSPAIVSDGSGGAIIAWTDSRDGGSDIYAQRISADGVPQWTTNGVAVCTAAYDQFVPSIISDGSGGAIIAWYNHNGSSDWRICAQHIGAGGVPQWTNNGITISAASYNQTPPNIISDGYGGAIFSWWGSTVPINIYVQRINASGVEQWTPGGVATCAATLINGQGIPNLVSDGNGGALISWTYNTSGSSYGIYAQWIKSDGSLSWSTKGVSIYSVNRQLSTPKLASDYSGGAIIVWTEYRSSSGYTDVYAQRILADSTLNWSTGGVRLCTYSGDQLYPNIISDGSGGAIVTWNDYRLNRNVYAQKIDSSGIPLWNDYTAAAICTATGVQYVPVLTSDNNGGAIITWYDARSSNSDIYAQRVNSNGSLTSVVSGLEVVPNEFALAQNYPNPFNPSTKISWQSPVSSHQTLKIYDVLGNEVAVLVDEYRPAGNYDVEFNSQNLSSGIYFYKLKIGKNELVKKMLLLR